ncbi:MAG: VirB3 family type IV secretion system protein [Azoarcus sp.]|jgi:type IV secretion system protein VirB3|nr:VirB3 family type IV secretion system protein [Azoarcus sp.]
MRQDPLFKGATRPALYLGVPLVPLLAAIALPCLAGVYCAVLINDKLLGLALLAVPIVLVQRAIVATDDQQFRLLGLKMRFRFARGASARFWKSATLSPVEFPKRPR